MQILTNGTDFQHADQTSSDPATARFDYGPARDRIRPEVPSQWWGAFAAGDLLELEVEAGAEPLTVEVLDTDFRPLCRHEFDRQGGSLRLALESYGLVYLRFHAAAEVDLCFRLVQLRAHPAGLPASRILVRWRHRVRRAGNAQLQG